MNRRNFIRLAGGGTIAAATTGTLVACGAVGSHYPAEAVEAWQGPVGETDVRRRAVAYAITAPNSHNLQPWLVDLRESGVITLRTDPARVLPQTDPGGRQILIGHGAFLELLVMALAQQGVASEVLLWPQGEMPAALKDWDDRPVARITLKPGGQPDPLFAQVLLRDPRIMMLDEPVSALDLHHQMQLMEHLCQQTREQQWITLVVLHDLNLAAQFADQLIVLAGGDLQAFGPPARVLDAALIERLYQVPVEISHDQHGIPFLRTLRKTS